MFNIVVAVFYDRREEHSKGILYVEYRVVCEGISFQDVLKEGPTKLILCRGCKKKEWHSIRKRRERGE